MTPELRAKLVRFGVAGGIAVLALGLLIAALATMGGSDRPSTSSTTLDPSAPPPIGQLTLEDPNAATTSSTAVPDGWTQYRSPDGTFAIDFPAKPTIESTYLSFNGVSMPALLAEYQVGTDGAGYRVLYNELPTAGLFADSQQAYDAVAKPTWTQTMAYQFAPGIDAVQYDIAVANHQYRGLLLLKSTRLYLIEGLDASDADFERFARSFKWLADPAPR